MEFGTTFGNFGLKKPTYYYQVDEHLVKFGQAGDFQKHYCFSEIFTGNLLEARQKAIDYYLQRNGGIFAGNRPIEVPIENPEAPTSRAAYSVTLSLIEFYDDEEFMDYPLYGKIDKEIASESHEYEQTVIKEIYSSD